MKIALIGYGKMGKTIERLATEMGHEIVLKTNDTPNRSELLNSQAQVAIEFSNPDVAFKNINVLLDNGLPVVCGTTGWLDKLNKVIEKVEQYNGSFLYASNFSLGVNLFFEIVQRTAHLMNNYKQYDLSIEEIHHTEKKDEPSGTAITIAEKIILESSYKNWALNGNEDEQSIPIYAKREENVPGTHKVLYKSIMDEIELKHTAFSRDGFALGAIKAAEYIYDKSGVFHMRDVLGL